MARAKTRLAELGAWRLDTPRHARAAGFLLDWLYQRHGEAEAAYRKALELDPRDAAAWNNLGGTLVDMGRIEAGVSELLQGLALEPENSYGRWLLGRHWQSALSPRRRQDRRQRPRRRQAALGADEGIAGTGGGGR